MTLSEIKEYFDLNMRPCVLFESVDSTNTYLKKNRHAPGTVAIALSQSAGHGQYGRVFESPESGLYMSLCVRFVPDFPITLAAAHAVTDALTDLFSLSCGVKWINDIIADGRKLCGILAESVFGGGEPLTVVGFGMNLKKGGLSREVSEIAISLEELLGTELPDDALARLALKISENLETELSGTREAVIKKYRARCLSEIPDEIEGL